MSDLTPPFQWHDFEEDVSSDAIPGKYVLTIADSEGTEVAVIVHRVDGELTEQDQIAMRTKENHAQMIVEALNAARA